MALLDTLRNARPSEYRCRVCESTYDRNRRNCPACGSADIEEVH